MENAQIGNECNICDHAFVETGVILGDRVTVKNRVLLFDGVTVQDDVFLGPGVTFTNDVHPRAFIKRSGAELDATLVRRGATLGAGVVVVCGISVGEYAFVGAGSVLVRDVPAHAFVVGNPGRIIGWACTCGRRLPEDLTCCCGLEFRLGDTGLERATAAGSGPGPGVPDDFES